MILLMMDMVYSTDNDGAKDSKIFIKQGNNRQNCIALFLITSSPVSNYNSALRIPGEMKKKLSTTTNTI